jgi:5,10-methylene-tetrahydrofolate dehydrogenase/methenyl tetrahydrofolate cyclohydrolase
MVRPGAVVIDVAQPDRGSKAKKLRLVGDVDFDR